MPGTPTPAAPSRRRAADHVSPPKGLLNRDEYRHWARLAPAAISRGLLTRETAHGFALLCQMLARRDRMETTIETDGWTYTNNFGERKRHALWGVWQELVRRIEQNLARFGLTADGKPAAAVAAPEENPWAAIVKR